ncbi:MAG: hypothetical protein J5I50_04035 [Chitinophagaceae bacterium]|nr:hypothetical protein [Chitinophagaceae bacterium]
MKSNERKFFERSHPSHWFQVADELHESLLLLYNENKAIIGYGNILYPAISKAYFLLAGYSLENLIKAILIVENPTLISENRMNKALLKHDLFELYANSRKIRTNKQERNLLSILSEATPYWSRYPVPLNASKIKEEKYLTDKIHLHYISLFEKSRKRLYNMTKNGYIGSNGERMPGWSTTIFDSA